MATGPNRAQRRAEKRSLSAPSNLVRMDEHREKQSLFGKDSPLPTLMRWRGEMWGSLTWSDVVSIMVQAEQTGATETWARLTRRMYQDGKILAARSSRLDPIAGADFEVEPGGTDPIDIQAAKDCDLMLRSLPDLATTLDAILDAIMVGWSVNEIIWGVKGSWIWPSRIDTIEPHRIRFTETIEPYLYDDGRLMNDPGAIPRIRLLGKPLRENKYIVHMPRAVPEYAIAAGLCRPLVRYWWAKWQCIANWLSGSEVAGNPRTVGYYDDPAATGTARTQLYNELVNISANSTVVTSKNNKVEFVSPSAQGTGSVWSALADWADKGIVITVLGSTLNTEIGSSGGNRAAAESQGAYTIDPRLVKDSGAMWATIARDFLTPFLSFNDWRYGGRMPAIPKVKSRFREELEPKPSADLIDIGGATINEIRKRDGLPPRPDGEVIAKRQASGGFGAFSAPAQVDVSAGGAPAASPFAPWDLVERMTAQAE